MADPHSTNALVGDVDHPDSSSDADVVHKMEADSVLHDKKDVHEMHEKADVSPKVVHDNSTSARDRVSVFDRLSTADGMHIEREPQKMDYRKAIGQEVTQSLSFFPLPDKKSSTVAIPLELAKEMSKSYNSTAFGYFLGPRLHFPVVLRAAKALWGRFGFKDGMMNDNGIYFFRFNDVGGCSQVIEQGPVMIRGVPMFLSRWEPTKGLHKPDHTSCPLWVKLHNVPLVAFNREGIGRLASALGVPKHMDACTTAMCDKQWGKPGFAKVLVDVWAVGTLKRELEVLIPHLNSDKVEKVLIQVEYIWEPSQCSHCCVFGHKASSCVKAAVENQTTKGGPKGVVDSEGFRLKERKQWRKKSSQLQNLASTSGSKEESNGPAVNNPRHRPSMGQTTQQVPSKGIVIREPDPEKVISKPSVCGKGKEIVGEKAFVASQDSVKEPSFVQSIVKSFRLPIRGAPLTPSANRFDVLSSSEDDEADLANIDVKESPSDQGGSGAAMEVRDDPQC